MDLQQDKGTEETNEDRRDQRWALLQVREERTDQVGAGHVE